MTSSTAWTPPNDDADVAHLDERRAAGRRAAVGVAVIAAVVSCVRSLPRSPDVGGWCRGHGADQDDAHDDVLDGESTLSRTMPDWSDCMTTAPRTAPGIVPMPPANDVPPMTAAAMTCSSAPVPEADASPAFRRAGDHGRDGARGCPS